MSQKNEAPVLILSLLITLSLIGVVVWWLLQRSQIQIPNDPNLPTQSPANPSSSSGEPIAQTFAAVKNVPSGLFNYGGSTTWAPIRGQVDPVFQQVWSSFQLRYTDPVTGTPGSSSGIRMLLDNQLAFAQSSRSLKTEEYETAQQRGFTLREIPVGLDAIAIAVHPSLNIPGLTVDQLKGIYTGQITNWNQVGGPDLSITPYSRRVEDGGTVVFFLENVLGEASLSNTVQFVANTTSALRVLSADPGGIYYASAPEVVGQCTIKPIPLGREPDKLIPPYQLPLVPESDCPAQRNQINADALKNGEYPLTRNLFVIVKQNGQIDQQAGEAYADLLLTNEGQDLISKAGFVRIR
ncbi:MAG: PstS family phosphate ABC transporter substrate-binding protein [Cyanobacteria bacterium RU_5_0]|nr:PstS family phosphate ABC transporter substrate-binding protein [Cyanobacteria bacterium RU_5_0]